MQVLTLRTLFTAAALSLGASSAAAQAGLLQTHAPVRFNLEANSSYTVGCVPPCLCPIIFFQANGSLEMTLNDPSPLFASVYTISNLTFFIGNGLGGTPTLVTGTGSYWNSTQLGPQHRLELDLVIGNDPPAHFESDWVTAGANNFPTFSISIAENGFFCNDRIWNLNLKPDLYTNFCTSTPNSTGSPALITASGSNSVGANNLQLHASPVPAGQPGLFYFGSSVTQVPFGDGFRCVTGFGVTRLAPSAASAAGQLSFSVDNTNLPNGMSFFPGTTWLFQGWYRDPAAGLSGFNLTDGAAILFDL